MTTNITKLSDRAMLVKLTTRRPNLVKRNEALTAKVAAAENDTSITVLTRLFKDKASPINLILRKVSEVYTYHRENTLPYVDAGPRILPSAQYFDYTAEMKQRIAVVELLLQQHMPGYDQYVIDDVKIRNGGFLHGKASKDEYPTPESFQASVSMELRFMPMPDKRHFLFDLSDEDLAAIDAAEAHAAQLAHDDMLQRMLKPLHALCGRLAEYQGQKGERFHRSIVENVIEGCDTALKLALDPSPELVAEINNLRTLAQGYLGEVENMKSSALARQDARAALKAAADKMSGYF